MRTPNLGYHEGRAFRRRSEHAVSEGYLLDRPAGFFVMVDVAKSSYRGSYDFLTRLSRAV